MLSRIKLFLRLTNLWQKEFQHLRGSNSFRVQDKGIRQPVQKPLFANDAASACESIQNKQTKTKKRTMEIQTPTSIKDKTVRKKNW